MRGKPRIRMDMADVKKKRTNISAPPTSGGLTTRFALKYIEIGKLVKFEKTIVPVARFAALQRQQCNCCPLRDYDFSDSLLNCAMASLLA